MKKLLGVLGLALISLAASGQFSDPAQDVPAYNSAAPTRPVPPIRTDLTGPYFAHAYQVTIYKMAAKVAAALFQQPCYCHCDRAMGHSSLHSCFEGLHGAECSTCMKEAVYTYRQTKISKTPAQIRAGIERGEWMNIDLDKVTM